MRVQRVVQRVNGKFRRDGFSYGNPAGAAHGIHRARVVSGSKSLPERGAHLGREILRVENILNAKRNSLQRPLVHRIRR